MATNTVQIYPSFENCQHTDEAEVLWHTACVMLSAIVNALPEAERKTARIAGWQGLRLVIDHTDTPAEVQAKRDAIISAALANGAREGLTAEQVAALAAALAAV